MDSYNNVNSNDGHDPAPADPASSYPPANPSPGAPPGFISHHDFEAVMATRMQAHIQALEQGYRDHLNKIVESHERRQ